MQKNEFLNTKNLVRLALVAAAYAALTVLIQPLSYGAIQFRFSEALVLLAFYRKDYSVSLILGCFIANLFSPFGLYDIVFGTLATALAVLPMYYVKNIFVAAIFPVITNGLLVGYELYLVGEPFLFSAGTVALGEFAVVAVLGILLFRLILEKNRYLMQNLIASTKTVKSKTQL